MHVDHATFLQALAEKRHVTITFLDEAHGKGPSGKVKEKVKEKRERTLTCAPLDFGPLRGSRDQRAQYQLWDLGAKRPPYNVTILPDDVRSITALEDTFDPADIIKWAFKPNAWTIARDWGPFS